jgi:RimJ/RimL family protein N-acetyltransferase
MTNPNQPVQPGALVVPAAGLAAARAGVRGRTIRMRLARPDDAQFIYDIRSDEDRTRHRSAIGADVASQRAWLERYLEREATGSEFYFVIEDASGPVGALRLYDYRGDSFSWGSWIIRPGTHPSVAMESALCVYELAFGPLGFERAHFEVRKGNERVIAFHERFGARRVGEDELHYLFNFGKDDYAAARKRYAKFLPAQPD